MNSTATLFCDSGSLYESVGVVEVLGDILGLNICQYHLLVSNLGRWSQILWIVVYCEDPAALPRSEQIQANRFESQHKTVQVLHYKQN